MDPEDPQFTRTLPSQSRVAARVPTGPVPATGEFIDRYRVRERIGEGGMGVVYAAEDPELGRTVAIKLLRTVEGSDAEVHQRRLLREAQALARVSHRNLVTVFDVGTRDGRVWIAMEYVVGDTLDHWLAREHRTWREIVDVFVEAARGLAAVHSVGLVHRDFKPGNVIVRGDGAVQVLDFGLVAQAGERIETDESLERGARPALDALAAALTETGGIMGTPAYMAPEQFLQLSADARADQFSFSVALYEALYGHRPFKGRDLPELMRAAIDGLPDLPPELPGLPEVVRRVISRGLAPAPEARFPSMRDLVAELERTREPPRLRVPSGWPRFALGMLVGGGALALGLFVWLLRTSESEPAPTPAPTAAEPEPSKADAVDDAEPEPEPEPEVEIVIEAEGSSSAAELPTEVPIESPGDPVFPQHGGATPPVFEAPAGGVRLPGLQDLDDPGATGGAEPPREPKPTPPEVKDPSDGKTDDKPPAAEGGKGSDADPPKPSEPPPSP